MSTAQATFRGERNSEARVGYDRKRAFGGVVLCGHCTPVPEG